MEVREQVLHQPRQPSEDAFMGRVVALPHLLGQPQRPMEILSSQPVLQVSRLDVE